MSAHINDNDANDSEKSKSIGEQIDAIDNQLNLLNHKMATLEADFRELIEQFSRDKKNQAPNKEN